MLYAYKVGQVITIISIIWNRGYSRIMRGQPRVHGQLSESGENIESLGWILYNSEVFQSH